MLATTADWANVLVAFIVGLPGLISAIYAVRVHHKVKTPSGTSIGRQVENALHTGLANNYQLRSITKTVSAPTAPASTAEAAQVPKLPEGAAGPAAP